MKKNPLHKYAPFGIRHEIAKRYTPIDWAKSRKVQRRIEVSNAEQILFDAVSENAPKLIGRLGGTEARFLGDYQKLLKWQRIGISPQFASKFSPMWKKRSLEVFTNAGFYWDHWSDIQRFSDEYLTALRSTDVLGAWGVAFTWVESLALENHEIKLVPVGYTAPWVEPYPGQITPEGHSEIVWSRALEGNKALVVSGFAESIAEQHLKAASLFKGAKYPNFEIVAVKAPITSGEREASGKSWFELLEDIKSEIARADFDVALIAAGAYSYPIANFVKQQGKIGVHCGGGLQLFFGVMGNRWNNSPEILKFVSDLWTRPKKSETPASAQNIEGACYW